MNTLTNYLKNFWKIVYAFIVYFTIAIGEIFFAFIILGILAGIIQIPFVLFPELNNYLPVLEGLSRTIFKLFYAFLCLKN